MELQQDSTAETPTHLLTLGTRRSKLARVQTDLVAAALQTQYASSSSSSTQPPLEIRIHAMDPLGDRDKTTALYKLSDGTAAKSLWTGELEELLARNELDVIVHSLKDMPTTLPRGLVLGAVLAREDARDALVLRRTGGEKQQQQQIRGGQTRNAREILQGLPEGSVVGTSSLRRMAQLHRRYPQLRYEVVRGNVPTRLRKLDEPSEFTDGVEYAALILAAAGLIRLELGDRIDAYLAGEDAHGGVLHAVGQGAIGIEARADDSSTLQILSRINDQQTWSAIVAERALLRTLEGGCSVPIGVETRWAESNRLVLKAAVVSVDGQIAVEADGSAVIKSDADAEELGSRLAHDLIEKGANKILDAINEERRRERGQETAKEKVENATAAGIV